MQHYVIISVTLPVCLHLDKREFCIPYLQGTNIIVQVENILSGEETDLGTARGMEVDSDVFSHYRFSRITLRIPHLEGAPIETDDIMRKYEKVFFEALNQFIDSARLSLERYGLRSYHHFGEFRQPIIATSTFPKKSESSGTHSLMIQFPKGKIKSLKPNRSESEHAKLQEILTSGVELHQIFMADAKRELYYNNFIQVIIYSVIALEIEVSQTIKAIGLKKGISKGDVRSFIKDVGLTGNIKSTLKLLAPSTVELPNDVVFEKCKEAITRRNRIVHAGFREVPSDEINKYLSNIERMIVFCEEIKAQSK